MLYYASVCSANAQNFIGVLATLVRCVQETANNCYIIFLCCNLCIKMKMYQSSIYLNCLEPLSNDLTQITVSQIVLPLTRLLSGFSKGKIFFKSIFLLLLF